ncbi:uncharacterized protein LOC103026854 isoform X3 [Astyanax mexicanus]|uniref:uncharacterized protein LOC103026854 isoform X3 n=1 Tax=Astyanax mexicanus TaxID=7994 RepID=UPI0020CB4C43|nr:uncharacterized protein LOC103026854 isoform X3 [Astyanax mexicanus]
MSDASMMNSSSDRCRAVVVSGVPDELCSSRMNDKLTIHFQCRRSHGGDVEMVQYPTHLEGVAFVTFDNWRDADRVVKSNQVLKDKEFKEEHPLTVYTYTPEVAFYAYADLDLSLYPDPSTLIATLRSNHKSVRIQPSQNKPGFVSAEGPFAALQRLRKQLLSETQNKSDISDEALRLYKASSLDKALRTDKARNLEKASVPLEAWSQDKASSLDRVSSPDLASSQDKVSRSYRGSSQDKDWAQKETVRSYKTLSPDKTLSSDKASIQEEPLRSDKAWTQGEASGLYKSRSQDKASLSSKAWTQEEALRSDKARTQKEALRSDRAWTQEGALRSGKACTQEEAVRSDKACTQKESLRSDKAWTQEEALRSDKAWTQEETLRLDKAWTQEEAFRSDKARTQEEALRSDKAWTQGEPLRSDKARTQGEALRSYNTSRQDKASSFDRSRSRDKASISDKARTQEEALRSDKDRTQDKAPRSYKASSQDNASRFDKSWRQDAAGQLKVDDMTITNGTNCVSFWLDTHIYKYMQMVERNEWDRCVGRYNVTAHAVSTGEVTEVKLHGRCEGSVLLSAQGELETLVAKSQDTLRTQHIDCSSADAMERLLQVCKTAQSIYTKVCYFPSDSCVEVIGPSSSSHRFCEFVKTMTEQEF